MVRAVNPASVGPALANADYAWVLIAIVVVGLTFITRTVRWAILLHPIVYRGTTITAAMLVGQTLNFLLPLRAGDVLRSIALSHAPGSSVERVLGSVAIEKVWDWLMLTALVLIVALIAPLPEWFVAPARSLGVVAALALIGLGVVLSRRQQGVRLLDRLLMLGRLPERWRRSLAERANRLLDGMEPLRRRNVAWRAGVWSAITWLLGIVTNVAVMRAFGVDSWPAAMFLMAVLMVGVALPPSIAALGIFEALTMLALGVFGVPVETALAIGVALHLVIFAPALVVGSLLAVWEHRAGRLSVLPSRTSMDPVTHD